MAETRKNSGRIPGIRGVTYQEHGASFRLKWRENQETPTGVKRVQRYYRVDSEAEIAGLAADIRKALDEKGYWTEPEVKVRPPTTDLEALSAEWLNEVGGLRGHAPNTRSALKFALVRYWAALRKATNAGKSKLPVRLLTEKNVALTTKTLRDQGNAPGTIYQTVHPVICDFWPWAARQGHPELPDPPPRPQDLLPRNPQYEAPPDQPTWGEINQMILRVEDHRALVAGIIMRATGLRIDQVSYIEGRHFERRDDGDTLLIVKGKSQREQSLMRRVPVPSWLVPLLKDIGAWKDGHLLQNQDRGGNPLPGRMQSPRNLTRFFTRAWKKAAKAKKVRPTIWIPENRHKASTTHCIRGAYQYWLMGDRVQEFVLDYLVGHQPRSTRGTHYAHPPPCLQREAVDKVPPIDPAPTWPPRVLDDDHKDDD